MKYTAILFLFFCEFTLGQIPGNPTIINTREFPTVYTLSYVNLGDVTLEVTAQVINTGLYPVTTTGILWGTSQPTITNFFGKTEDGNILGQPFTSIASPLPDDASVYVVAYATTAAGTFYGKVLTARTGVVRSPYTGKVWMDMNLGASDVPKAQQLDSDTASFGHLYQWGRKRDGHQIVLPLVNNRTTSAAPTYDLNGKPLSGDFFSEITDRPSNTTKDNAPANKFIKISVGSGNNNGNWLSAPFDELWQGLNGYNVPCPSGFRVPYGGEFMEEVNNTFPSKNITGAFNSFLRLPLTGYRDNILGKPSLSYFQFNEGRYWTADYLDYNTANFILINSTSIVEVNVINNDTRRARGYAVRCIKGEGNSGGTVYIDAFTTNMSSTGNLVAGEPVSGVTQTIFANVKTPGGTYDINTILNNGVMFSGKGTLAGYTNNQPITLTASGTPLLGTPPGSPTSFRHNFGLFSFDRPISGASSNGTAEVNSYTNLSSTGITRPETPILEGEVTQTITADVSIPGKYNIQAVNNGITFSASGTFTGTGFQPITLNAYGTPITAAINDFTINTTPSVTFSKTTHYAISNGTADISAYNSNSPLGNMYLGNPVSGVTQTISANIRKLGTYNITTPSNNGVTFSASGTLTGATGNRNITLTASGTPIETGTFTYTINTEPSISFTRSTIVQPSTNGSAIVASYVYQSNLGRLTALKPASGVIINITADVTSAGTYSITTNTSKGITFAANGVFANTGTQTVALIASGTPTEVSSTANNMFNLNTDPRLSNPGTGRQIFQPSTNGTAIVTGYSFGTSTGTNTVGFPVSNLRQPITATVNTNGSYFISTDTVNGVTFSGNNNTTMGGTGARSFNLTAVGTPLVAGTFTYTIDTNPGGTFTITY